MTDHAATFHALHTGPDLLILPNAWGAASAALMASAGAKAVATSSAAVAWAQGFPDGDALPTDRLIAVIADVVRVTPVPVTADIEGGYTDDLAELAETIRRVAGAGAVGINLEDGARDPDLQSPHASARADACAPSKSVRLGTSSA
ncbi:MAG: isocitrate lyase/phosphoenolpyruvate mutase family protein [Phenylobacterium sp.]|uniref:isocitrate lyase/phosphoenolpyruvate mutase family protein n=1 Tax=Phenylobacterium sp. TaxID=1871053 RepID=UPI00272862C5|nr:isocitrate lyase/phosphoenolpyruvate mutase family protein [Phenylobacterium sp.]MDO8900524.1 isocitrate lyase/phosphoenolpyruvate mutase family protein [Phenylobacterium sp.]